MTKLRLQFSISNNVLIKYMFLYMENMAFIIIININLENNNL